MNELVDQIAAETGLDSGVVRKAVGIMINFLRKEGPPDKIGALFDKLPGASALGNEHDVASGGLLGVFNDLTAIGLGMGQVQTLTKAFVAYSKKVVGNQAVDDVVNGIPGLGQFV